MISGQHFSFHGILESKDVSHEPEKIHSSDDDMNEEIIVKNKTNSREGADEGGIVGADLGNV